MSHLSLALLGGFEVRLDDESLTAFGADKVRALLAFLAVEAARPHRRAELAGIFWPDLPEKKAAHNLSQSLFRLRRVLREQETPARAAHQPFLLLTHQDIQFNPLSDYQLDVTRFQQLLQAHSMHRHSVGEICSTCIQWLHQAADLYRGDLLAGFFVQANVGFEEWRLARQEMLHSQALDAFARLTAYHEQRGEYDLVQKYARRLVTLEPWGDQAQLQLMRALIHTGEPVAALKQYESYRDTLDIELGMAPSAEATALYEQTRQRASETAGDTKIVRPKGPHLSTKGVRHHVTALICGQPMTASPLDPEDYLERLVFCRQHCEGIINRFGGHRLQRQGNECLVLFGYPYAMEDASRRAVDAGLAITQAMQADNATCIGIHTGVMIEGEHHGQSGQDRELFGDTPNIARLCKQLAQPGQVLVTEETMRLVQYWFDGESVKTPNPAGFSHPLRIYQVRGASHTQSRLEWLAQTRRLTALVGREHALKQLLECRNQVRRGQGQIVVISGDPGIGKSRLLHELKWRFLEQHKDGQTVSVKGMPVWIESRCLPHFQNTGLYPIINILEQMLGFTMEDSPDVKRAKLAQLLAQHNLASSAEWLLASLLGLPSNGGIAQAITTEQRERMREVFIALLQKQSSIYPVVLVIEDLHWSDPSTMEWLNHSFDALAAIPCFALFTHRPTFSPPWLSNPHLISIPLEVLAPRETEQMVSSLVADSTLLQDELRKQIVTQSDGIPLFVEELTEAVIESESLPSVGKTKLSIPATLHDSLMARLDHVGAAKETAQWAAVLGREFSYAVLRAVVPFDESRLQSDLSRLKDADLLYETRPTRVYNFKHGLVQEAAYSSLLKRTRQEYHRRIAKTLQEQFPKIVETRPEVLAQHYVNAGLETEAIDHWLLAGEQSGARGATQEAHIFFDRAMELIEPTDNERRWRGLAGRERVYDLRGERAAQKADIDALLQLSESFDDDTRRAQAYTRLARYATSQADYQAQWKAAEAAIAAASRAGDLGSEVEARAYLVTALLRLGERTVLEQSVEETLARAKMVEDENTRAYAMAAVALYYFEAGDYARAANLLAECLQSASRAENRHLDLESQYYGHLGFIYAHLGLYAQAHDALVAGLDLANTTGVQRYQTYHRINLGYVYWRTGDASTAIQMEEQSLGEYLAAGELYGQSVCQSYLGLIFESTGNLTLAEKYLAQARTGFAAVGVDSDRSETQAVEARVALAQGRQKDAEALAIEVWNYIHEQGSQGLNSPSLVYMALHDVFQALDISVSDNRARDVLEVGYRDLMQRAQQISDDAWRQSFFENVVENRTLKERWEKMKQEE